MGADCSTAKPIEECLAVVRDHNVLDVFNILLCHFETMLQKRHAPQFRWDVPIPIQHQYLEVLNEW